MTKQILITGRSGFLGKIISGNMKHSGSHLYSLGRNVDDELQYDLTSDNLIIDKTFDLVIHCAGKAHCVPKNDSEGKEFFDVNVEGTRNLLFALEKAPELPKSFIFISSVAVYGLELGNSIAETTPLLATDPYGKSKIEAEKAVSSWCEKNNVICTILRLPLLAGQNPPGNLGAMIKGIKGGYYFNIAGGKAKKSIVLADDVAKIILPAAEVGGIYNLTDGYHPSFSELANDISLQLGKSKPFNMPYFVAAFIAAIGDLIGKSSPIDTNKLKKITNDLTFDDATARKSLGWNPVQVLQGFKIIQ